MSAQYDLYETPDIKQTGEKQPLHPRIVPKGTIGQDEFLDRVHKFTGISRSLLAGAMQSFQNELKDLLANGWIVELGEIGYFSVSLKCDRARTTRNAQERCACTINQTKKHQLSTDQTIQAGSRV
mgnify:CR=1 FL=1